MNCLIRALLVAAIGQADEDFVIPIRTYLVQQGVAVEGTMLDLADNAGGFLIAYLIAQGTLQADRGIIVHRPNFDPHVVVDGANPIHLWLADEHFQAIIPM